MWQVELPLERPLSLNDRQHWRARALAVAEVRELAAVVARARQLPTGLDRVQLELHYIPRDRRRRDPLNLVATLKAVEDGLVDYGLIPDDTPDHSIPTMPVIDPPDPRRAGSRIYVNITEVPS